MLSYKRVDFRPDTLNLGGRVARVVKNIRHKVFRDSTSFIEGTGGVGKNKQTGKLSGTQALL